MKILNLIRSQNFMLYVCFFTVLFLTPNTYYVFHSISSYVTPYREIASAGVAVIIAAFIMVNTLRKKLKVAKYYSWFEISISTYYYITTLGWDWSLIPAISFTLILPYSVRMCAEEVNDAERDTGPTGRKIRSDKSVMPEEETKFTKKRDEFTRLMKEYHWKPTDIFKISDHQKDAILYSRGQSDPNDDAYYSKKEFKQSEPTMVPRQSYDEMFANLARGIPDDLDKIMDNHPTLAPLATWSKPKKERKNKDTDNSQLSLLL